MFRYHNVGIPMLMFSSSHNGKNQFVRIGVNHVGAKTFNLGITILSEREKQECKEYCAVQSDCGIYL